MLLSRVFSQIPSGERRGTGPRTLVRARLSHCLPRRSGIWHRICNQVRAIRRSNLEELRYLANQYAGPCSSSYSPKSSSQHCITSQSSSSINRKRGCFSGFAATCRAAAVSRRLSSSSPSSAALKVQW